MIVLELVWLFILPIGDLLNWLYYWSGHKAAGNLKIPAFSKNFFAGYLPVALASIIWIMLDISAKAQLFSSEFQSYLNFGYLAAFPILLYILLLRPRKIVHASKHLAE